MSAIKAETGPDETMEFCQAVRFIFAVCQTDKEANDRLLELVAAVELDVKLTPWEWINENSPLSDRVLN